MSRSKAKGTAFETSVVNCLRNWGFMAAERRVLHGANDQGDITGLPGVVIEVKNQRAMDLAGWMREAEQEADNANADLAVVWHKRKGKASAEEAYVTMSAASFLLLLRAYSR